MVEANDFNTYLCKHTRYSPANLLFNEFLAAHFLHIWKIRIPHMVFLHVKKEHITQEILSGWIQYENFNKTCLGFEYMSNAIALSEMDAGFKDNVNAKNKLVNKEDLFRIVLFDIWLSNEDRTVNNYNLMLNPDKDGYYIIPIDHEHIFNQGSLETGIYLINENDSIIMSSFVQSLFPKHSWSKTVDLLRKIKSEFDENVVTCGKYLNEIMTQVPKDWDINIEVKVRGLEKVFSQKWRKQVMQEFEIFIHKNLRK